MKKLFVLLWQMSALGAIAAQPITPTKDLWDDTVVVKEKDKQWLTDIGNLTGQTRVWRPTLGGSDVFSKEALQKIRDAKPTATHKARLPNAQFGFGFFGSSPEVRWQNYEVRRFEHLLVRFALDDAGKPKSDPETFGFDRAGTDSHLLDEFYEMYFVGRLTDARTNAIQALAQPTNRRDHELWYYLMAIDSKLGKQSLAATWSKTGNEFWEPVSARLNDYIRTNASPAAAFQTISFLQLRTGWIDLIHAESRQSASQDAAPVALKDGKNWPATSAELEGRMEVRVVNPNDFSVLVGLRSGGKGKDFTVGKGDTKSVQVPNGRYDIYFQYSSDPDGLYQGDSFTLNDNGVEVQIVKVVNGNYGIRKVK